MVGSLIEAHLFGSMNEDEECDYDHTLIDDSNAQGGDKENCSCCGRQFKQVQGCCLKDGIEL
jgi:hypothetical protein